MVSDMNRRALAREFERIHMKYGAADADLGAMVGEMQMAIARHLTAPDLAEVMAAADLKVVRDALVFYVSASVRGMLQDDARRLQALVAAFGTAHDAAYARESNRE